MDVAKLQLTIDGQQAIKEIASIEAALKALPQQTTAAANQVNAALNSIKAAAQGMQAVQVNVNSTTQQATQATHNYSAALQQIIMQLSQTNALLNASVNSTNALGAAMANTARQTATVTANTSQAAGATGSLNVSLGSTLRTIGALVGIQFGAAALRELVVGSVQADIGMQRIHMTLEAVSGSAEKANQTVAFLRAESDRIGISFTDAATSFARFSAATSGTGISQTQTRKIFTDISEAAQRLHLSGAEVSRVFLALEQMASKGVVSMEELRRQLGNVIPGAFNLAARAAGVTTEEFNKMVKEGRVLAEDLLPKLSEEIRKTFPLGDAATATVAELNRVKNAWMELQSEFGKAARPAIQAGSKEIAGSLENIRTLLFPREGEEGVQRAVGVNMITRMAALPMMLLGQNPRAFDIESPELERLRMRTLALDAQRQASRGATPAAPRAPREDADSVLKAERMMLEFQAEQRGGYEKKLLMLDATYAREQEQIAKLQISEKRRAELRQQAEDSFERRKADIIFEEGTRERREYDRQDAERQKRLEATEREAERVRELFARINSETGGGGREADEARINFRYNERMRLLAEIALTEDANSKATDDAARKLEEWRNRELAQVEAKYARHFVGEGNVIKLLERRKQLELELLSIHQDDPEGGDRVRAIQTEMRDINQTIALQFQTGGVKAGDAFVFGMRSAIEQWGNEAQRMATIGQGTAQALESSFTDAFTSMLLMQKDVAAGFNQMANSIIADIARIVVQQSISIPIANAIMGAFSGGIGGFSGSALPAVGSYGTAAGLAHIGGVAGAGETRTTTMAAFAFAPRYHGGGVVGDEVPIVARRGEVVFTPEQMQALGKAVAGNQQRAASKVEVVNVFDETEIDRRIAANPNIVLNVIGKNSAHIRRMLT